MSGFSAAVKIGDLDDFLSPATDCVIVPSKPSAGVMKPQQTKSEEPVAAISLSDCLACSGCVTSAETLLLQSQSVDELLTLSEKSETIVFSISSASRRSLSEALHVSPSELCLFLESRLRSLTSNVLVLDTSVSEAVVVQETLMEMESRKDVVLTSHCPGWTCYATKVLDDSVLSHLSRVKSPEQLSGVVVKSLVPILSSISRFRRILSPQIDSIRFIGERLVRTVHNDGNILHVLISPCFDKKLEVIRPDYTTPSGQKAVDLVLASSELIDLLSRVSGQHNSTGNTQRRPFDIIDMLCMRESWAAGSAGCESGGYAQAAAKTSEWPEGKNKDLLEFDSFIRSHGFRNIQNITRRLKSGKLKHSKIVEVMACPGGCPKGGGQPKKGDTESVDSSVFKRIQQLFIEKQEIHANEVDTICDAAEYVPARTLRQMVQTVFGTDFMASHMRTEWKSIPLPDPEKGITASSIKW